MTNEKTGEEYLEFIQKDIRGFDMRCRRQIGLGTFIQVGQKLLEQNPEDPYLTAHILEDHPITKYRLWIRKPKIESSLGHPDWSRNYSSAVVEAEILESDLNYFGLNEKEIVSRIAPNSNLIPEIRKNRWGYCPETRMYSLKKKLGDFSNPPKGDIALMVG